MEKLKITVDIVGNKKGKKENDEKDRLHRTNRL